MKPQLLKRNRKDYLESISFQHLVEPHFLSLWHYHPELELVYIVRGTGNYFVGDAIESFAPGTLVLLGSDLPHKWINDQEYFQPEAGLEAESMAIHFFSSFLHADLHHIPEFRSLGQLFERAKVGIHFQESVSFAVAEQIAQLGQMDGFRRLIAFLEILKELTETEDYRYLSSAGYLKMFRQTNDRQGRIHEFIMNNFQRDITLEQVAAVAHMNKAAFCRYFKRTTKKSFSRYLNEIRIGYACKMLQEKEGMPISEVAFESGYNNVSNFNRQFKLVTGFSPSAYLRQHLQQLNA